VPDCSQQPDSHGAFPDLTFTEFYQINEAAPLPMLDNKDTARCADSPPNTNSCPNWPHARLANRLQQLVFSDDSGTRLRNPVSGDGNEDKVVNGQDIALWRMFAGLAMGGSSWSDFNLDGKTNAADLAIIHEHLGTRCLPKK
jgi:hypothetical protein